MQLLASGRSNYRTLACTTYPKLFPLIPNSRLSVYCLFGKVLSQQVVWARCSWVPPTSTQIYILVDLPFQDPSSISKTHPLSFRLLGPECQDGNVERKGSGKLGVLGTWQWGTCKIEKHVLVNLWGWMRREKSSKRADRSSDYRLKRNPVEGEMMVFRFLQTLNGNITLPLTIH